MKKRIISIICAAILMLTVFSSVTTGTAAALNAEDSAAVTIALKDDNGNDLNRVSPGGSFWAVISISDYADQLGGSDIVYDISGNAAAGSVYNGTIALIVSYLELDPDVFSYAEDDGDVVWDSPYKDSIDEFGGSFDLNWDNGILKILISTDNYAGLNYSITESELDAAGGELFRIKFNVSAAADEQDYTIGFNTGNAVFSPGIAAVYSDAQKIYAADVRLTYGSPKTITVSDYVSGNIIELIRTPAAVENAYYGIPEDTTICLGDTVMLGSRDNFPIPGHDGALGSIVYVSPSGEWDDRYRVDAGQGYFCGTPGSVTLYAVGAWSADLGNVKFADSPVALVTFTVADPGAPSPFECSHANTVTVNAAEATCGDAGYTGDAWCLICHSRVADGEVIPPTGNHTWGAWEITTEATAAADGEKTRTCSVCGAAETLPYYAFVSGTTGEVSWSFIDDTLIVSGSGATADYSNVDTAPWKAYRTSIKHIFIEDGVTYVGNRAFKGLNKVVDVTFGKDVKTTGYECFFGCTSLADVSLNEGLENINALFFYNCGFSEIEIPSTVTNIANRAFKACAKLESIDIPDSVTYLGYEVFMNCTSLADVDYTAGAAYINSVMFSGCTSLETFTVPANIAMIRSNAFANCTALTRVVFEDDDYLAPTAAEPMFASTAFTGHNAELTFVGWVAGKAQGYAVSHGFRFEAKNTSAFKYTLNADGETITVTGMRGDSTTANIPVAIDGFSVTAIGSGAFRDSSITTVTIPNTVTTIGGRAFQGSKLTAVVIPASVTDINYSAFQNCTELTSVTVGATATTVNSSAFTGCTNATVYAPAGSAAAKAAAAAGLTVVSE